MAVNYGITHCKRVLARLAQMEDRMFAESGHGFDKFQQEAVTEREYKRLLKQSEKEKELGLQPTYRPDIHGES